MSKVKEMPRTAIPFSSSWGEGRNRRSGRFRNVPKRRGTSRLGGRGCRVDPRPNTGRGRAVFVAAVYRGPIGGELHAEDSTCVTSLNPWDSPGRSVLFPWRRGKPQRREVTRPQSHNRIAVELGVTLGYGSITPLV